MPDAQSRYCLSMICAPEVEEKLLDALLSNVTDVLFLPARRPSTTAARMAS